MRICFGILLSTLLFVLTRGDASLGQPILTPDLAVIYSELGGTVSMDCAVSAQIGHGSDLQWEKPAVSGVSVTVTEEQGENAAVEKFFSTIKISNIKQEHFGVYSCVFGNSKASFRIEAPNADKRVANFTYGDTNATLSCTLSGPLASEEISKVEWFRNDTLISKLTDKDRFTEDAENHTLTISKPTRDDANLYILRFTFKGQNPPYDCHVPYRAAPLVLDFDKSKNLIEDDNMELQCKVKGYPHSVVTWFKDNKVLNTTSNKRVVMSSLDGYKNARLIIKKMKFEDAGDYTCSAHSDWFNSSDSKKLVVRVKDKLAALWPFLGIVGEVVILCTIIFIYEKRRNKQAENESNNMQDVDSSSLKKDGVRHRQQRK